MSKEKQIEILIKDRYSRQEAENALKNGNIFIWESIDEFLDGIDESEKEESKEYFEKLSCVEYESKKYYIEWIG